MYISVSLAKPGGGGGWGAIAQLPPPPPIIPFRSFVGTCDPTSMSLFLYRRSFWSTNKILKEIAVFLMWKSSKLARSARSHIHRFLSMLEFCQSYCHLKCQTTALIVYVYRCILRSENTYISEALARAYKWQIHNFFFSVHLGDCPQIANKWDNIFGMHSKCSPNC